MGEHVQGLHIDVQRVAGGEPVKMLAKACEEPRHAGIHATCPEAL